MRFRLYVYYLPYRAPLDKEREVQFTEALTQGLSGVESAQFKEVYQRSLQVIAPYSRIEYVVSGVNEQNVEFHRGMLLQVDAVSRSLNLSPISATQVAVSVGGAVARGALAGGIPALAALLSSEGDNADVDQAGGSASSVGSKLALVAVAAGIGALVGSQIPKAQETAWGSWVRSANEEWEYLPLNSLQAGAIQARPATL